MLVRERARTSLSCVNGVPGKSAVSVQFNLAGDTLTARFEVCGRKPFVNSNLPTNASVQGLWDFDVVELFLSVDPNPASTHYFEFQVSPLNQFFELEIFEPRKKMNSKYSSGFRHNVMQLSNTSWQADMRISLDALGFNSQSNHNINYLRGGAFAILGETAARTYWALNLPKQSVPDFHLPEFFNPIF